MKHVIAGQEETEDFGAQIRSRSMPDAKDLGRLLQGKTGRIPQQCLRLVGSLGN
jgi:hypothetical protein